MSFRGKRKNKNKTGFNRFDSLSLQNLNRSGSLMMFVAREMIISASTDRLHLKLLVTCR